MEQSKLYQIKNITEQEYTLVGCDGSVIALPIQDVDKSASAFTIQDAKDGDILYTPKGLGVEGIFLVSGWQQIEGTGKTLCSNIGYRVDDDEIIEGGLGAIWWKGVKDPFFPATKEQRDLLFQKMKENGYEWDAEKKELRINKIEQNPAWSEEDENMLNLTLSLLPYHRQCGNWLKSLKDRVQPKQEWSEEDEDKMQIIINIIKDSDPDWEELINWLKSLRPQNWTKEDKERYISCLQRLSTGNPEQPETINSKWFKEHVYPQATWKPSDEQIYALRSVVTELKHGDNKYQETIEDLYNDLEKLRGE